MEESTTGQPVEPLVADNSSTTNPTTPPAEQPVQGTGEQPGTVSNESANTNTTEDDDAALASFAKGQGITDLSELSDREKSLLKMARDNKSAYDRTKQNQPKLEDASKGLATLGTDATDIQKLNAKVANMEFAANKANFMKDKDPALEPVMAQVLAEKRAQYGDDYARQLLGDLPTLYGLAQLQKPADTSAAVEAARKDERSSINQSLAAGAPNAHASSSAPATPVKVTDEWIENEYDSTNPEHRKLLDAALRA